MKGDFWSKSDEALAADVVERFRRWPWSQYDGVADAEPRRVTLLDGLVSAVLESHFVYGNSTNDWPSFVHSLMGPTTELLDRFGPDVELWADTPKTRDAVEALTQLVLLTEPVHHWGPEKLTKVLHRKRPRLVPILAPCVVRRYQPPPRDRAEKHDELVAACEALILFREETARHLARLEEIVRRAAAQDPALAPMTPVRCLDALVYWHEARHAATGWKSDDWA